MSAIALLPDDLLSNILCLGAGSDIACKFSVAQVSAHWRRIALDSPLLWTCICLSTRPDCRRLALVLGRCGPSALLDIQVSGPPFHKTDAAPLEVAMQTLEPYAPRIRVLDMREPSDALLNRGLEFPLLLTLRVHDFHTTDGESPYKIHLTAPALGALEVTGVAPVGLADLLSERLVQVRLASCPGMVYADFLTVLERCVRVEDLTFRINKVEASQLEQLLDIPIMRHLRTLHLFLPVPLLIKTLDNCVSHDTVLSEVAASVAWGHDPDVVRQVCAALLRGVGPLVVFHAMDSRYIALYHKAGLKRVLYIWNLLESWKHVWPYLAESHGARDSVREIALPFSSWNELADDFAAYPPGANVESLRVMVDRSSDADPSTDSMPTPSLQRLMLPGLKRVAFDSRGYQLHPSLIFLVLRSTLCDAERTIEVETSFQNPQTVQATRTALETEAGGRWVLFNRMSVRRTAYLG